MNRLTSILLLTSFFITHSLYSLQYHDVQSGKFDYHGQTGFIRTYQTQEQSQTGQVTIQVDDAIFPPPYSGSRLPRFISLKDINGDGWTDFTILFNGHSILDHFNNSYVYHGQLQTYISFVTTNLDSNGIDHSVITYKSIGETLVVLSDDAVISSYNKVFMRDLDQNGYDDICLIGWNNNNGTSQIYWQVSEIEEHVQWGGGAQYRERGSFQIYATTQDAFLFKGKSSPFHYYLLIQSDSLNHIYAYDSNDESLSKVKTIPTDTPVTQIAPLNSEHLLLSSYNLLFNVNNRLILKHYSATSELSIFLPIDSQKTNTDQGYQINEVYFNETNIDGKFAIWWEQNNGSGKLIFYSIEKSNNGLYLQNEAVDGYSSVEYTDKPFRVVYRPANMIDNGSWLVIQSDQETTDNFDY